jgi:hypothetical protein
MLLLICSMMPILFVCGHLQVKNNLGFSVSLSNCTFDDAERRFACADRVCESARKRARRLHRWLIRSSAIDACILASKSPNAGVAKS